MSVATMTELRECPRCKVQYPKDAQNFYVNPKTGSYGYCRGPETNRCNQALDREYRERAAKSAALKAAIERIHRIQAEGEKLTSRKSKQTGDLIEVIRHADDGGPAFYFVLNLDRGAWAQFTTRKEAVKASSHPADWS